ncbi:MAG TPA: choice-of-anchor Q domain-containing protein, partial [Thermoleophilaceae bacterium]
ADNTASGAGTGQVGLCDAAPIFANSPCAPKVTFTDTIVSGGKPANCAKGSGSIVSGGSNIDSGSTCGFGAAGDKSDTDPKLGPLADNGGQTQTMALLSGSPAIDAVLSGCPPPDTDQRGITRPKQQGCDIGAFEYVPPSKPPPTGGSPPTITIVTPGKNAKYVKGRTVKAKFNCSDPDGASDVKKCRGTVQNGKPINTSTTGTHSFTVNASDNEGHTAKKTAHYTVVKKPKPKPRHRRCGKDEDRGKNGRCISDNDGPGDR